MSVFPIQTNGNTQKDFIRGKWGLWMALQEAVRGRDSLQWSLECEPCKSLFLGAARSMGVRLLGFHPSCGTSGKCLNLSGPQSPPLPIGVSSGCCLPPLMRITRGGLAWHRAACCERCLMSIFPSRQSSRSSSLLSPPPDRFQQKDHSATAADE